MKPTPNPQARSASPFQRRAGLLVFALLVGGGLRLIFPPPAKHAPDSIDRLKEPEIVPSEEDSTPRTPQAEQRVYLGPGSPLAPELNAPQGNGPRDVEILHQITGAMLSSLKGAARPPLGSNSDFARALRGENKLGVVLLPARHPVFNAEGLLVDRWQTPYHFHPVSSDWVEIRSAGPDRVLFTDDDFVDQKSRKK